MAQCYIRMSSCGTHIPPERELVCRWMSTNRWRREFNKAVKLPSRDTIFDYFLSVENGECRFEPWTKHKIFKVIDFNSSKMKMNEVRKTRSSSLGTVLIV